MSARAQSVEAEPVLTEVVVTGTRISGFNTPTPVTTLGMAELAERGVRNFADVMYDIPALKPVQNTGQTSQPIGAANLDLRALGPNRTLVMLNGRRFAATDPTGGVDVNVIPAALISRAEIVTGGASAAYGSDAVSGVVNIVLDTEFEGIKGDVQYGQSTYDDNETTGASLSMGGAFMDGRLRLLGSLDYFENLGQLAQNTRPWARGDYAILTNPRFGQPGEPRQIISPDARFTQMTFGGVTARNSIAALRNLQFGPGGVVMPYEFGTNIGGVYMTGGDGGTLSATSNIAPEIERRSGFGRASFAISPDLTVYADALISRADIFSDGTTATDNGTLVIQRDNAFLPQQIRDILIANDADSFRMGRIAGEDGAFTNTVENEVERYGLGFEGHLPGSWKWDAFVQYSRTTYYREDGNNRDEQRWLLGLDSVIDPSTGDPTCRALLNNPNATDADDPRRNIRDCVPINVFGAGSISQAALDYYKGVAWLRSEQTQTVVAANLEGSPFSTWAGPVAVAFGAEYRDEKIEANNDELSQASGWKTVNPKGLNGSLDVAEVYAEAVVPLLDKAAFADLLELNAAARFTDYSTSGQVETWKLGVNYAPVEDLRFRTTLSRDIRAANINELFSGQNQFINTITNPLTNLSRSTLQLSGGNPTLTPEIGDAFTIGAVFSPSWMSGLRLSFDYYNIEIEDAITALSGQQIVDGCLRRGQSNLCPAITFDGDVIMRVEATLINAARVKTSGFDVEAVYTVPLGAGDFSLRGLVTHVDELSVTNDGDTVDYAGQVGTSSALGPASGAPEWRATLSTAYRTDRFAVGAQARYIDGGIRNAAWIEGVDIDSNTISSRTYVDLNGSVNLNENFEIYAVIDNVFNRTPPLTPNSITAPSYASSAFYDRIGRFYAMGARFKF
ncbi:MAG TPA: TonB-dependent receptor [Steroidobacter sp.]|uniref:TonB-dependent receptor domain-containing protein n=1 Tax=Steroidobacter sp. TaxID=1978227 RepID=UPI002ED7FC03